MKRDRVPQVIARPMGAAVGTGLWDQLEQDPRMINLRHSTVAPDPFARI